MRILANLSSMKPQGTRRLAAMLAPTGEPASRQLTLVLDDLRDQVEAIGAVDGVGAVVVELAHLSDDDVRRLGLRLRSVQDAILDRRPGQDKPFLDLLAGLRVAVANEQLLRDIAAGRLIFVGGNGHEEDVADK